MDEAHAQDAATPRNDEERQPDASTKSTDDVVGRQLEQTVSYYASVQSLH